MRIHRVMFVVTCALAGLLVFWGVQLIRLDAKNAHAITAGGVLVALGGGGLALAWPASTERRFLIVLLFGSILLSCYLAEAVVQLVPNQQAAPLALSATHDRRTKREVIADLRSKGDPTAVPMVYPSILIHFPHSVPQELKTTLGHAVLSLGGISHRMTVLCNESGKWAIYRSDERGFNNPEGAWSRPVEVAVVGDSFSHGNCVDQQEGWVWRIRPHFGGVLNLGMGGNGPLFALAGIREYLMAVRPPIVVWQYFEGHDTRVPGEKTVPILSRYWNESGFRQSLADRQGEIDSLLERMVENELRDPETAPVTVKFSFGKFVHLSTLLDRLGLVRRAPLPPLDDVLGIVSTAKSAVESWGGTLYFLYLPSWLGLTSTTPPAHYASHDRVIEAVRNLNIPVIDLDPVFRSHHDVLTFFPYGRNYHYNADGYALVAETVLQRLKIKRAQDSELK